MDESKSDDAPSEKWVNSTAESLRELASELEEERASAAKHDFMRSLVKPGGPPQIMVVPKMTRSLQFKVDFVDGGEFMCSLSDTFSDQKRTLVMCVDVPIEDGCTVSIPARKFLRPSDVDEDEEETRELLVDALSAELDDDTLWGALEEAIGEDFSPWIMLTERWRRTTRKVESIEWVHLRDQSPITLQDVCENVDFRTKDACIEDRTNNSSGTVSNIGASGHVHVWVVLPAEES